MNLGELLTRESIRDLVARYNFLADRGTSAEVAALFAGDGVLEVGGRGAKRRAHGRDRIAALLDEIKSSWRDESGTDGPPYVRHYVSTHVIDHVDSDHARGSAYVLVLRPEGLTAWGRYFDEYRRTGERWVFASRHALPDTESAAVAVLAKQ